MNASLHLSRRTLVAYGAVGAAGLAVTGPCSAAQIASVDRVVLPDFRQDGDRDDTAALHRAFATGRPVHAPAGCGSGSGGRYVVGSDTATNLPSGATLFGDGIGKTVFVRPAGSPKSLILHCDSGSPDRARNITGLRFRDLSFEDDVARLGFAEYSYLVMLNGVTDVAFERVAFRGFRGDGLHLGSGTILHHERHNVGVFVRDCVFDGVNANNRNAISVIDCERLVIERSRFLNNSRQGDGTVNAGDPMNPKTGLGQPGSIDLEPNGDAFAVVRDVVIQDNFFSGGGGFAVSMLLPPNKALSSPIRDVRVTGNHIADRFGAFQLFGYGGGDAATDVPGYGIVISNNLVQRCRKPFVVNGMRDLAMTNNRFIDCVEHAELGYNATIARTRLTGNLFERSQAPHALWVRDGTDVTIEGNHFVDCGPKAQRGGIAIAFVQGTMRRLRFIDNDFSAPTRRTLQSVSVFQAARIDPRGLLASGNKTTLGDPPVSQLLGASR